MLAILVQIDYSLGLYITFLFYLTIRQILLKLFDKTKIVMYSRSVILAVIGLLKWSDITYAIPTPSSPTSIAAKRLRLRSQPTEDNSVRRDRPTQPEFRTRQDGQAKPYTDLDLKVVYRGDQRSPQELMALGGIPPEFDGPTTNASYSLLVHHVGEGSVRSAYTSTSRSFGVAVGFATQVSGPYDRAPGWIYEIQPTPNMIDMNNSGLKIHYKNEEEFSATGGIRWDQIKGYMYCPLNLTGGPFSRQDLFEYHDASAFFKKFPDQSFTQNTQYNTAYNQYRPSSGQPQLAGNESTKNNEGLYQGKTLEQWAIKFMNDNGAAVGWSGSFPLNLKTPASSQNGSAPSGPTNPDSDAIKFPESDQDNDGCERGKAIPGPKGTYCIGEFGENFGSPYKLN